MQVTDVILEYSQLGRAQPGQDLFHLRPIALSIVEEAAEDFAAQGITAQVSIAPERVLLGSAAHFASILRHLVRNAREALVEQCTEKARELRIDAVEESDSLVLQVADTGAGIAPEDQDKLFEPFFSTRPSSGMGLGLGMVEKMVRLYGGSIRFDSQVDQGTTFFVAFPMP